MWKPIAFIALSTLAACGGLRSGTVVTPQVGTAYTCSDAMTRYVNQGPQSVAIRDTGGEILLTNEGDGTYRGINGDSLIWQPSGNQAVFRNESGSFYATCQA